MTITYKWIDKFQLWDCTDGEIHGGGKTKELALADFLIAKAEDEYEATIGWAGTK